MGVDRQQRNRYCSPVGLSLIVWLLLPTLVNLSPAAELKWVVVASLLQAPAEQAGEDGQEGEPTQGQAETGEEEAELDEIARRGIPKPEIPAFKLLREATPLPVEPVSTDEILAAFRSRGLDNAPRTVDDALTYLVQFGPRNDRQRELLSKLVRLKLASLTDPQHFAKQRRNMASIERMLRMARQNPDVYRIVRDAVLETAREMFQHHIVSRVAAGIVLTMLADEAAIPLLVEQLNDDEQHESVKIWCIKAISAAALADPELRLRNKQYEQQALEALLRLLRSESPLHLWTQREIVLALGALGRPTEDLLARDANVARELILVLRGTNLRSPQGEVPEGPGRAVRVEATQALAMLVIPPDLDYNFQIVAAEIARFAVEATFAALRNPLTDRLNSYLYLRRCQLALTLLAGDPTATDSAARAGTVGRHPLATSHADPQYVAELRDRVTQLSREVFSVYRPDPEELRRRNMQVPRETLERAKWIQKRLRESNAEALAKSILRFLEENPPRGEGRLTPTTAPLPPAPEVRLQTAAKGSEEAKATDGVANP